jgi:Group II intron, maturase-specific domain/Reverse transcriptase (RNA-dependent DNA polymerase)
MAPLPRRHRARHKGRKLSPLSANIALSVLDRHFEDAWTARRWHSQRARDRAAGRPSYRMIRYADDFVVLVRGTEAQAHAIKEQTAEFMRERMRLTLSPEKTAVTHVDDGFDLLGFRIVRRPWRGDKRVAYTFPSRRALREVMHRIKTLTNRSTTNLSLDQLIHVLNPILRGWANYYRHAASSRCFAYLSHYVWWRVIRWLRKKYPRLTWKQIRRRCWGHHWTGREGARLAWPDEVPVTRYRYRGHRIPSPWAATGTGRATTRPGAAVACCSCSHAHSSMPTSRRRPALLRRTSSAPRRRSRSACLARAPRGSAVPLARGPRSAHGAGTRAVRFSPRASRQRSPRRLAGRPDIGVLCFAADGPRGSPASSPASACAQPHRAAVRT